MKGRMKQTLGEVLKAARVRRGLTQEQLGSQVGAAAAHLAYLENDQRQPSLELLSRLAEALKLEPNKLFCWPILRRAHYSGDKHGRGVGTIRHGAHLLSGKAYSPGTMCSRTN
jgi:transcriptional regulator with XRE-family HTH domain